jgi:hypothetical protein
MFSLFKTLNFGDIARREGLPFIVAFTTAELMFKFKSFALECIAFLITWYVISFIQSIFVKHD